MTDVHSKLRSLQPEHVSAYLTYSLCDVRQSKHRSHAYQLISEPGDGIDSTVGAIINLLVPLGDQAISYVDTFDPASFAAVKPQNMPDIQGLMAIAYQLFTAAADYTVQVVKDALSKFYSLAVSVFHQLELLVEGASAVGAFVAELTIDMADFVSRFADLTVATLKPIFEVVMRFGALIFDKFSTLVKSFATLTGHVVVSLARAGVEAATETIFMVFAAGMEIPKFAGAAYEEVQRYLQNVSLNINSLLPTMVPTVWNAAQWVLQIPWVSRIAYFLGVTIARIAELVEKWVMYLISALSKMARLAFSFFGELFSHLGHASMQKVIPLFKPIIDHLQLENDTLSAIGLPAGNFKQPLEAARKFLEADKEKTIKLSDKTKERLQDSIIAVETFFRETQEAQHRRYVAMLKDPGALIQKVVNKARFLKQLSRSGFKDDSDDQLGGISADIDVVMQEEIGMTGTEFQQHYTTLQDQLNSAIVLAAFELEPDEEKPAPKDAGLRRRRRPGGEGTELFASIGVDPNAPNAELEIEIERLNVRIIALDKLISETKGSSTYQVTDSVFANLEASVLLRLGGEIQRAMNQIRIEALATIPVEGQGQYQTLGYYVKLQQELIKERDAKSSRIRYRLRSIQWWAIGVTMAVGFALVAWYMHKVNQAAQRDQFIEAQTKMDEFEKWTEQDPFIIEMHKRWQKDPSYLQVDPDRPARVVDRIDQFKDYLQRQLFAIEKTLPEDREKLEDARILGRACWKSFESDVDLAIRRREELKAADKAPTEYIMWVYRKLSGNIKDTSAVTFSDTSLERTYSLSKKATEILDAGKPARLAAAEIIALPNSFSLLESSDFKFQNYLEGPSAYKREIETQAAAAAVLFDEAKRAATNDLPWYKRLWAADDAKNQNNDAKVDAYLPEKQYLAHVRAIMAWRIESLDSSLTLYRKILALGALPWHQYLLKQVGDVTTTVMSEVAEITGVSNIDAGAATGILSAPGYLVSKLQSFNFMNYVKLFAFYRWLAVTSFLVAWIVIGVIYIVAGFFIAWFCGESALAWSEAKRLFFEWLPVVAKLAMASLASVFAYWQARVFVLGLILQVVEALYWVWLGPIVSGWKISRAITFGLGNAVSKGTGAVKNFFSKNKAANDDWTPPATYAVQGTFVPKSSASTAVSLAVRPSTKVKLN